MSERDARLLVDLLHDHVRADKRLGQHYLLDEEVLAAAVSLASVDENSSVLEIGCGPGTLTNHLLGAGARVSAIEIDEIALKHMELQFSDELESGSLTLIEGDALLVEWPSDITHIVANIPYQISSPLLERIARELSSGWPAAGLSEVVLLLQEEFAQRMAMAGGAADRGPLGFSLWLDFEIEMGRQVSPSAFSPQPRVKSRLMRLTPTQNQAIAGIDRKFFRQLITHCFLERRKKMRNRLNSPPKRLTRINGWHRERWTEAVKATISEEEELAQKRPEELTTEDWVALCRSLQAV
jgi:16S rRNA (adenine1518-N6/adenine1519-N6)-dimethyltransferase